MSANGVPYNLEIFSTWRPTFPSYTLWMAVVDAKFSEQQLQDKRESKWKEKLYSKTQLQLKSIGYLTRLNLHCDILVLTQ